MTGPVDPETYALDRREEEERRLLGEREAEVAVAAASPLPFYIPARYAPPKTRIGVKRCAVRDKVKKHSKWVGGIDPMNIVIVGSIIAVPVIGAALAMLAVVLLALILIVVLW